MQTELYDRVVWEGFSEEVMSESTLKKLNKPVKAPRHTRCRRKAGAHPLRCK